MDLHETQGTYNLTATPPLSSKIETATHTYPTKCHVCKNGRMMWVNTIDLWSIHWIKVVVDGPNELRTCRHLHFFVYDMHAAEVDSFLVTDLCALSPDNAHWILRDLQHHPHFIHRVSSFPSSLEVAASIITNDSREFQTTALLDLGCTGSSIDQAFVLAKGMNTHKLP